jgi:hypothetical protein
VLRNDRDPEVDQLGNAILVHDVFGFEVAVGVGVGKRGAFLALGGVHVDESTAYAHYDVQLASFVQYELVVVVYSDLRATVV